MQVDLTRFALRHHGRPEVIGESILPFRCMRRAAW